MDILVVPFLSFVPFAKVLVAYSVAFGLPLSLLLGSWPLPLSLYLHFDTDDLTILRQHVQQIMHGIHVPKKMNID